MKYQGGKLTDWKLQKA